jgi:hypothetical protein
MTRISARVVLFVLALFWPGLAVAQSPKLQLDHLNGLAGKATSTVNIDLDQSMLQQTAGFLAGKNGDEEKVRNLLAGLKGITVRSFEFKTPGAYSASDVEQIQKQLNGPNWVRIVSVHEKDETTDIYFFREGNQNGGLVVLSAEPLELTVVNIVGRVDLATMASMGQIIPKVRGLERPAAK